MAKYALAVLVVLALVLVVATIHCKRIPPADSLYSRLGGVFPIAAVVNYFSDEILKSPIVGVSSPNPQLRAWSRGLRPTRLPGLKFMRTLWLCDAAGGPYTFHASKAAGSHMGCPFGGAAQGARLNLGAAHRHLRISSAEFDEVARILHDSLAHYNVPAPVAAEVLHAFAAHKPEVVSA